MNHLHYSAMDQLEAATHGGAELDAYSLGWAFMLATVVCVLALWVGALVWELTAVVRSAKTSNPAVHYMGAKP